jgi:hypothetical protein
VGHGGLASIYNPKMPCCAIILSGDRAGRVCDKNAHGEATRCTIHARSFDRTPTYTASREVKSYVSALTQRARRTLPVAEVAEFTDALTNWAVACNTVILNSLDEQNRVRSFPYGPPVPERIAAMYNAEEPPQPQPLRPAQRQPNEFEILRENIRQALMQGVVNNIIQEPPAIVRRNPRRRPIVPMMEEGPFREEFARIDADRQRQRRMMGEEAWAAHVAGLQEAAMRPAQQPPVQRELAEFAADRQNIHTIQSVVMTKAVVERVLKIAVPEEYRWNMRTVSKTAGEIIAECKLTPHEMVEMINRYVRDDDVYEMGKGIYGKVLDGVWQYIRNSADKADLCRILKQELKDNIGMCAQGNLTRLCNVLSGYMDGIGPQESASERLGRELPKLMELENVPERMAKAKALLREVALPETEWAAWLDVMA